MAEKANEPARPEQNGNGTDHGTDRVASEDFTTAGDATLEVRPARPEDRDAVLAFCAHTWADGDYIEFVWDRWINDERGVMLVGLLDGKPVALNHMLMLSEDEAWLEGMRVDPAYRREGFGRIITSRAMVVARERGAAVIRLITSSDNLASQGMISRFGFVRVAEMVRYRGPALPAEEATTRVAVTTPGPDDFERIWEWLVQSNLVPLTGGLQCAKWKAQALTEPLLRDYLAAGQVRLIEEWETITALAIPVVGEIVEGETGTLVVRYVDGQADAIGRMALALRVEAATSECKRVEIWLPNLLILHDAMDGAGYERDDEISLIFAREL
jgi:ribosomal protein S18 acetylase RimI-like enzyme